MLPEKMIIKLPKWKIRKKNWLTITFFFVIAALENFSYLISQSAYMIPGLLKLSDIGVLAAIMWSVYVLLAIRKTQKQYFKVPALFIVVLLFSSISAYRLFGQGFDLSIRQQRRLLACILLYYAVFKALNAGKILKEDVIHILCIQAVIEIILYSLQLVLADKSIFLYATIDSRYNSPRLRVSYLLPLLFMYFCIEEVLHNRHRIINLIFAFSGIFVLAGVCKHRAPSLIAIATLGIAYFIWKKNLSVKLFTGIVLLTFSIGLLSHSVLVQDALDALLRNGKTSTLGIRLEGQEYYLEKLTESPLFGFGAPNQNNSMAVKASGEESWYLLADNGIVGFLYCYGAVGLLWLGALWIFLLKQSYELYKRERKYHYFLYLLFETGNLYIGMHWYYYYPLPFFMNMALLNYEYISLKQAVPSVRRMRFFGQAVYSREEKHYE